MYCPFCSHNETKVLESRILEDSLRRRRECLKCANRFTTYENAEFNLRVLKKDGKEEAYDLEKISSSLQKACGKTDIDSIKQLAHKVQQKVLRRKINPIKSTEIGKFVLQELKKFDKLSYVRFATVYKSIEDLKELKQEISFII